MQYIDMGKPTRHVNPLEVNSDGVLTVYFEDGTHVHVSSKSGLEALGTVVDEPDWPSV